MESREGAGGSSGSSRQIAGGGSGQRNWIRVSREEESHQRGGGLKPFSDASPTATGRLHSQVIQEELTPSTFTELLPSP